MQSSSPRQNEQMASLHSPIGRAAAPMPSLTSHPPLIGHRIPMSGPLLKELPANNLGSQPYAASTSSPRPSTETTSSPPPTPPQEYPCPFCDQVYKKVGHLNRHTLTHAGRRFACEAPGCDKTFTRLDNMRTHMKNMHPSQ